ncbi:MAG: response regulator, partial [Clostridia bacterium]|nr:response regulator [Clostridia bacterium]
MYKVLIVDDEQGIRDLVGKYCALEGYTYGVAGDGFEAIEKVKQEDYDIVCMDVMMPELDGFSAVREIRKFSTIPIIMLSARTETYDKIHGFEIGADDYISKPFSPKELM